MRNLILTSIALATALVIAYMAFNQTAPKIVVAEPESGQRILRFAHNTPENSALHQAALRFADLVKERSQGKLRVDVYPAQQLGNDYQMFEMARNGELDILLTPTAKVSVTLPEFQYADLPFFFPNRATLYEFLDNEPGDILLTKLNSVGLHGVTFWENGFKHFTGNRPFLTPADFKNTKIRVMKSRIIMEQFNAFGAEPIPIDFHTTRQALADGVVDGQENPLVAIYSMGFHEVQSDLILSEHAYLGYVLAISNKTIEKLGIENAQLLINIGRSVTNWERTETQRREHDLLDKIAESGIKIHELTPQQRKAFAAKTAHIVRMFEPELSPALVAKTQELRYQQDKPSHASIAVGLNIDLRNSPGSGLAIKRGAELAAAVINENGGLLGKPLKIITRDHLSNVGKMHEDVVTFLNDEQVVALMGGKYSEMINDSLHLINEMDFPYLIPWAAEAKLTDNHNAYRVSANDRITAPFLAQQASQMANRIAIIYENSIWGRSNFEQISELLTQRNALVSHFSINRGHTDSSDIIAQLRKADINGIICIVNAEEGASLLDALAAANYPGAIISHWGILGESLFEQHYTSIKQLNLTFLQTIDHQRPQAQQVLQHYRQYYSLAPNDNIASPHAVLQSYDAIMLLAEAIKTANTTDRGAVKTALSKIPQYDGALKKYVKPFYNGQHDALTPDDYHLARFNQNGQIMRAEL